MGDQVDNGTNGSPEQPAEVKHSGCNWLSTQWLGYGVGLWLIWHGSVNDNGSSALKIMAGLSLMTGAKILPTEQLDKFLNKPVADVIKKP